MSFEFDHAEWSAELNTGVDVVDEQHQPYFNLLNDYLKKASETSSGPQLVLDLAEKLTFLHKYAEEQFSTEEAIMREAGYPDYESHKEEHQHFLHHVEELYLQMKTRGYSPSLGREVNYYIIEWFVEHIRLTDKKLVGFLNEKSAEDSKLPRFLRKLYESLTGNS